MVGFFGQSFEWLARNIGGATEFVVLGIGTGVVSVGMMVVLFKKRDWL